MRVALRKRRWPCRGGIAPAAPPSTGTPAPRIVGAILAGADLRGATLAGADLPELSERQWTLATGSDFQTCLQGAYRRGAPN